MPRGTVTEMNALPLKHTKSPHEVIDALIADFGLKPVLMAFASRLLRRKTVLVSNEYPNLENQPGVAHLDDHLRADLGLPPKGDQSPLVDQIILVRTNLY